MLGFGAKELVVAVFSVLTLVIPFRVTTNGKYFPLKLERNKPNQYELNVSCEEGSLLTQQIEDTELPQNQNQANILPIESDSENIIEDKNKDFYFLNDEDNRIKDKDFIALDITSQTQYWKGENIFVAEGNAKASISGGQLEADYFRFDKKNKLFVAEGNVQFIRGFQYFEGSYFKFNLNNNKGFAKDIYGVINIDSLEKDLSLDSTPSVLDDSSQISKDFPLRRFEAKGSTSFQRGFLHPNLDPYGKEKSIELSINSWRVQSECINLDSEGWRADEINFTNDPFNPAQSRIIAREVIAKEDENGLLIISSNKGKLVLEDKLKIPTGKREFGKEQDKKRWVFAYDKNDRDGLYVGFESDSLELSENQELSLQPQFLIQRTFIGETKSYPDSGSSITSNKVKSTPKFSDLFGLEAKLTGKVFDWESEVNANISTFNTERFFYGSRYSANIKKNIHFGDLNDVELNLFTAYRYRTWNGTLGESDIHTAFGGFLEKKGNWTQGKTDYKYIVRSGLGNYQAEKLKSNDLITLGKASIFGSLDIEYPLITFQPIKSSKLYAASNSALPLKQGLSLVTNINSSDFLYSNGNNQASFGIDVGPRLTFGNFKSPILDYTSISVMPGYTVKVGDSPFKFDNANDLQKLSFKLTQRIAGPLVLSGVYDVNIDPGSDYYLESINSKLSILLERRSYGFGLFYDIKNEGGGLLFRLKGFDFAGPGNNFIYNENEINQKSLIEKPSI